MASGRAIVLVFAGLLAVAAAVAVTYKLREVALPDVELRFERAEAAPANATVHDLDYDAVHKSVFLEPHLKNALDKGHSEETERLRVEQMVALLHQLTGSPGPEWWVEWQGAIVRITHT